MAPRPRALVIFLAVAVATAMAAVCLAPAALMDAHVAGLTGGALRLAAAEGTVWRARGDLVAGTSRLPIAWRMEPWALVQGELRLHVTPAFDGPDRAPHADIAISGPRVALRDVDVTIPASALAGAAQPAAARRVGGDVAITAAAFEWAPPANRGAARLQWRAARIALADGAMPLEFGDVVVALAADGDRLSGPVSNEGGDLAIRGTIAVRADDLAQLSLVLLPRRPVDSATAQALASLATAESGGWRIEWRVPLR
jgi:hypothetical protein